MRAFEYAIPNSLDDAKAQAAKGATLKGAGLDLLDLMKERVLTPERVVSLHKVPELRGIKASADGWWIGAGTTLSELGEHKDIAAKFPGLAIAALDAATPAIRNRATVAGNLLQHVRCWYFRSTDFECAKKGGKDCPAIGGRNRFHAIFGNRKCPSVHGSNIAPPLLALGASVNLTGTAGERTVALKDFYPGLGPDTPDHALKAGELVLGVHIPAAAAEFATAYQEAREKESFDWPLCSAAVALRIAGGKIDDVRVVLGAVAPIPWRSAPAEDALKGKAPGDAAFRAAADAAFAEAKPLSENAYKIPLGKAVLVDALTAASKQAGGK